MPYIAEVVSGQYLEWPVVVYSGQYLEWSVVVYIEALTNRIVTAS